MIPPGGTFGFLGGGQLAWMMGFEARRMGYGVAVLDPDPRCPAARIADVTVAAALDDGIGGRDIARVAHILTCDTEHVPQAVLEKLERWVEMRPRSEVFGTVQDRLTQRAFLGTLGLPQPEHLPVGSIDELRRAAEEMRFPAILKSRTSGYDGRGQARVPTAEALEGAWDAIGRVPAVLEAFVPFEKEISVILARSAKGEVSFFPIAENHHEGGILRVTRAPATLSPRLVERARDVGRAVVEAFDYVGVLAVELFVVGDELRINEIAPRVHNSGHFTFGACITSQFEQHLRAIGGLPLGDPTLLRPTVMVNLLGEAFAEGDDLSARVLRMWPHARLHLYGKRHARPGRKMGHFLVLDPDVDTTFRQAIAFSHGLHTNGHPSARTA